MATKRTPHKRPEPPRPQPFHLRFEIEVNAHEAHTRFINRVHNLVFENFVEADQERKTQAYWRTANVLGEEHESYHNFKSYAKGNFLRSLQCIEAAYGSLKQEDRERFEIALRYAQSLSECDLGVAWEHGHFRRSGSSLLDDALVNDPLGTLAQSKYSVVREPLVKALTHLLEAERRPELFADVITDAYEALEACAKVATGRTTKDLSSNAEALVAGFGVSSAFREALKAQLKTLIQYGNLFRHAKAHEEHRAPPTKAEAEAFVYEVGVFLRLATIAALG